MRYRSYILTAAAAAAMLVAGASAQVKSPTPGGKDQQNRLRSALDENVSGSLVAELNRNKAVWSSLTAEQLSQLRNRYYAFLREDPDRRKQLMTASTELDRLTDEQRKAYLERAAWLSRVIAGLSQAQREQLKKLPPAERARRLLELKNKLPASQPASGPAAGETEQQPATAPAGP